MTPGGTVFWEEGKVSESPERVGANKFRGRAMRAIVGTFHSERRRGWPPARVKQKRGKT